MQSDIAVGQEHDHLNKILFPIVCEMPVSWGVDDPKLADKHKAIVNPETGKLFSIVSKDYKLIRHEQAIKRVERVLSAYADLGKWNTDIEFYNDGGRMRVKYRFPEIEVEIAKGDVVNPELQLFNSYDTSWPFHIVLGAFRLICTNGMIIGQKFLQLRRRHVYDFEKIDLEDEVSTALDRLNLQAKEWQEWADRYLTDQRQIFFSFSDN